MNFIELILNEYELFLLVFVRMTGIFIITPIFSRKNIPAILKISMSFVMALIVFNVLSFNPVNLNNDLGIFIILIKELSIGLLIGFVSYLFFISLFIAGQLIDTQIGFGMVNLFDPQNNSQVPITGNLYYILALLIFLNIDGHHWFIQAIFKSYETVPLGHFAINNNMVNQMISIFSQIFVIGFKVSSPVLATVFLTNVLLGILAKTMPQMNVFVVGMPLKILVGIFTIFITMPIYLIALQHIFDDMYGEIFNFLKILQKG